MTRSQLAGIPMIRASTSTGTCRSVSVTTAFTLSWLLSRSTLKSAIVGAAEVEARACRVQTMTWVMHSSRNTVPGGAMAPVSMVVSVLTTGPILSKARSLSRRPTASGSTAPAGSTSAVSPSP